MKLIVYYMQLHLNIKKIILRIYIRLCQKNLVIVAHLVDVEISVPVTNSVNAMRIVIAVKIV